MCENCGCNKLNEVVTEEKVEKVIPIEQPKDHCDCGCDDECMDGGCDCDCC